MKKNIKMEKGSSNERHVKIMRQKSQAGNKKKYLKPGALAQLCQNKAAAAKASTNLGKKRVALVYADKHKHKENDDMVPENKIIDNTPIILSPVQCNVSPVNVFKQQNIQKTPQTPGSEVFKSQSRLESLPMDLQVKILCHLNHDQLKPVFHVSERIRKAAIQAREFHFNYTTPERNRTITPLPSTHRTSLRKRDGKGVCMPSPKTPKAPKHGPRAMPRVKLSDMKEITAHLFPEPSVLSKPLCKNRVLFCEEELCQAVSQNKL